MACSSAAAKFTVRRRPAVLLTPAGPTPRELKRLSDIDDQQSLRLQMPAILLYRRNESMAGKDPAQVIRDALAKALVHYYPFAGRLREIDGGRKLAVDCNAEGVLFIEADADVGIEHFGGHAPLPPFPCLEELMFDVPGSSDILNAPILLFQVTRLACGGFILGVRLNHTMADAQGLIQFLGAMAELARGAQAPTVPPVWERELLEGRNRPQAPIVEHKIDEVPDRDTKGSSSSNLMLCVDKMALCSFFFGPREIAAIRAQLSPHIQKRVSNFDIIAGWLWKFRTMAIAPDSNEVMLLVIAVDARGRKTTKAASNINGIPIGYYGNAFALPVAKSTAGELCTNPVSYAVELVKKVKDEVDMEYMLSMADLMVQRRGQTLCLTAGTYSLTDESKVRFADLDFGWGRPVYVGPAQAVAVPSLPWVASFLLPFKNADGEDGIVVPVCLPGPAMNRLVEEMGKLRRPLLAGETTLQQPRALFPVTKRSAL